MALRFLKRASGRATAREAQPDQDASTLQEDQPSLSPVSSALHEPAREVELAFDEAQSNYASENTSSGQESTNPVLSDDDEAFLHRITSETGESPPLPPRRTVISDDGKSIDEPSIDDVDPVDVPPNLQNEDESASDGDVAEPTAWSRWSFVPALSSFTPASWTRTSLEKSREDTAQTLLTAARDVKARQLQEEQGEEEQQEQQREKKQLSSILSGLNLSAINNRVVGISKDTQIMLESFNVILKDLIQGVPTAYEDLEKLLNERSAQLETLYQKMPSFIQKLIQSIPTKMYAFIAPQLAAAMSSKSPKDSNGSSGQQKGDAKERKKGLRIPSLRTLVTDKSAVVSMLRSIVDFLELRFPAFIAGTNIIMSLAVFILLFVFWYCYRRGRDVRIAKEIAHADEVISKDLESGGANSDFPALEHGIEPSNQPQSTSEKELEERLEELARELEKPSQGPT